MLGSAHPPWFISLVQQIGEARFGVENIEELKLEDRRSWLTFTRTMAKAGSDFSKLAQWLEQLAAEEVKANIHFAAEQAKSIDARQKADARLAARIQKRNEATKEKAQEREDKLFEEKQADRNQERKERRERHKQSLAERETKRKIYQAREIVLMSGTAACLVFSFGLIAYGLIAEKLLFVGGSSISAGIALIGFIKMFLSWKNDTPSSEKRPGTN
jgi:hypothetical protein